MLVQSNRMIQQIILGLILRRSNIFIVRMECIADAEDLFLEWEMTGYLFPFQHRVFSRQILKATVLGIRSTLKTTTPSSDNSLIHFILEES